MVCTVNCITFAAAPANNAPITKTWTVSRPASGQLPLARLIRNPDDSGAGPQYALSDQAGNIQRYVEPVPGIDLEPYVGFAVKVRHDTGRTLLASQLELPGQEPESILDDQSAISSAQIPRAEMLLRGLMESPMATNHSENLAVWQSAATPLVQPAQYVQSPGAPVMIQEGMPMQPGVPYPQGMTTPPMMQQAMPIQRGMPPMMGPQGMVSYDPIMGGASMGSGPIYLDGPSPCGPQGCPVPCQQCPQPVVACPPPPAPLRWAVWGEALWLQPTGVDMAHAQQQDGLGGAGTVPFGNIGVASPEYDLGIRLGAQVRLGPKDAFFGQYTWFESDRDSRLGAPNIPGGGGVVGSLVHHPGAALIASAGPVNATYDIDFQVGDLAYRYFLSCSRTGEVSVFVGGRYGNLDQNFTQSGIFGGGLGGAIDTSTDIDFTGYGPIAGIHGERLVGDTRFSVYGKGLVAALTGSFDADYLMFNDTTDQTLARSVWSDDRIVPMLEYELGIMWTSPQNHFRLAVGYLASYWFNVVTTPVWIDAVQANNYVDISDTIAFDGAVGRVEFRW